MTKINETGVGSVQKFDSEEDLAFFLRTKQTWDLTALKQSLAEISEALGGKDFVPFPSTLFESLCEDELNSLQEHLQEFIGLHGDAKYYHWAHVFKRLNQSFLEEQDAILKECMRPLAQKPFCEVSQPVLLLLLGQAYLLEKEKRFYAEDGQDSVGEEGAKEIRLQNLKEAKSKGTEIEKASAELTKAVAGFEKALSKWAVRSVLPDVRRYVDQVLSGQLEEFSARIKRDRTDSLNLLEKAWLEPLATIVPQDGKVMSKGSLFVAIFDTIVQLTAEAAGGGEWKEATAPLLKSWGMHVKPDSIKHRRPDLTG